jgi:hypothetical protein
MALEKRTGLARIDIHSNGVMTMHLLKQIVDGDDVISEGLHIQTVEPPMSLSQVTTAVNDHLAAMGWPPIPADAVKRVESHAGLVRTPEVVKAFKATREAEALKSAPRK